MFSATLGDTGNDREVEDISPRDVRGLLAELDRDSAFLIVDSSDSHEIIQTRYHADKSGHGWIVERNDVRRGVHLRADTGSREWVAALIESWMRDQHPPTGAPEWFDTSREHRPSALSHLARRLFGSRD